MNQLKKKLIVFVSALCLETTFNEIFMSLSKIGFWNTSNYSLYTGGNFIILAFILQSGIEMYEQLYGSIGEPITKLSIKSLFHKAGA
jgi:hypothetical protein